MLKRILFTLALLIGAAHAMDYQETPLQPEKVEACLTPSGRLYKLVNDGKQAFSQSCASLHSALKENPYLMGVRIINISKLYTLRITGGTLNQTIQLNPVVDHPEKGPQYDIKYLLLNPMGSINIETFRPGSAIANQTQFRRLRGQDVFVINVDRIPDSKKFYSPIIMIDPYSVEEARTLYPNLNI
jgi:hypothetical protein